MGRRGLLKKYSYALIMVGKLNFYILIIIKSLLKVKVNFTNLSVDYVCVCVYMYICRVM